MADQQHTIQIASILSQRTKEGNRTAGKRRRRGAARLPRAATGQPHDGVSAMTSGDRPSSQCVVCALPLVGGPSIVDGTPIVRYVSFRTIGSVCGNCILVAANHIAGGANVELVKIARGAWHLLESIHAVRDGVSDESIRTMADALFAAITNAERSTRNVSDVSEVLDNVPD